MVASDNAHPLSGDGVADATTANPILSVPARRYRPLSVLQKFGMFAKASYGPRNLAAGALTAGVPRLPDQPVRPKEPSANASQRQWEQYDDAMQVYGDKAELYRQRTQEELRWRGRRFIAGFAQNETREFLQSFLIPSVLRQDPRYLPSEGLHGGGYRLGYAISRLAVTRSDSGGRAVNYSKLLGTFGAAAAERYYYDRQFRVPELATTRHFVNSIALNLAFDAVTNVVREFLPHDRR